MKKRMFFLLFVMLPIFCGQGVSDYIIKKMSKAYESFKNQGVHDDSGVLLSSGLVIGLGYGAYKLYYNDLETQKKQDELNQKVTTAHALLSPVVSRDLTDNMKNIARLLHGLPIEYEVEKIVFKQNICPIFEDNSFLLQTEEQWAAFMKLLKTELSDFNSKVKADHFYLERLEILIEQVCPENSILGSLKRIVASGRRARFKPIIIPKTDPTLQRSIHGLG